MVHAQVLLGAHCVLDDEGVAQPVVVDVRPHRLQDGPEPLAEVHLDGGVQLGADDGKRNLVPRHRVIGLWLERANGLGSADDGPTELGCPEGDDEEVLAEHARFGVRGERGVGCVEIAEHALQVVHPASLRLVAPRPWVHRAAARTAVT